MPLGSIKPATITQATLDQETAAFYDVIWKQKRLIAADSPGQFYVAFDERDSKAGPDVITVSEAMGYGMLITAFMAGHDPEAKHYFDGLYRFYKRHPSKNNPRLMAWCQVHGGSNAPEGADSAADADLDIAYALLVAHRQWGSAGEINYLNEGKVDDRGDLHGRHQCARVFGETRRRHRLRRSRVHRHALIRLDSRSFPRVPKITGRAEWGAVADKSYSIMESLQRNYSPETGLIPDFIRHVDNTPSPARPHYLETKHDGDYYYNACRVPFRVGIDYLLSGDPRSKVLLERMTRWFRQETGDDPAKIADGYSLTGRRLRPKDGDNGQMCFVAPARGGGDGRITGRLNPGWTPYAAR